MYQEETFLSNSVAYVHYYIFKPIIHVRLKGVIQIHHGMAEEAIRYKNFAEYIANHGYVVVVSDHVGHGKSLLNNELGYFGDDGFNTLVSDVQKLNRILYEEYPNIPHFVLGHSMGSFVVREYITRYGEYVDGVILSGTGINDKNLQATKLFLNLLILFKGKKYRSKFVNGISFKNYNKQFHPARTDFDWLTRDEEIVDHYINNSKCGFIFTLKAFRDLVDGFCLLKQQNRLDNIPKDLPILFISGDHDPVGHNGKDIIKLSEYYKNKGIKNVEVKLYKEARHEVLNENNRKEVYLDVLNWLDDLVGY